MRTPLQKLKVLAIWHYLVAVLIAILACLPSYGLWRLWQYMQTLPDASEIEPWIPTTMRIIGIVTLADGWILTILMILAGVFIHKQKNRRFCMIVGALEIPHFPFATILGSFTVSTLNRTDVEPLFYRSAEVSFSGS